ncbi:MAG: NADH-quinone oxidoreductase subunit L, partial [Candidatus Thermoplasmatota archaeon]|nr:NADH-quinone oxidoreductase subunit L [Candidatus Thermoplasmatota archaeon]
MLNYAWFIFLTPIIFAPISVIAGKKAKALAGVLASLSILISLILSIVVWLNIRGTSTPIYQAYNWFDNINAGI